MLLCLRLLWTLCSCRCCLAMPACVALCLRVWRCWRPMWHLARWLAAVVLVLPVLVLRSCLLVAAVEVLLTQVAGSCVPGEQCLVAMSWL